jgi:hypothetical protein
MNHLDSETLALVAMSEAELNQDERKHLEGCAVCARELLALRHTVATGRSARTVELVAPGEQLWSRIHGTLGLSQAVAAPPRVGEFGLSRRAADATDAADAPDETSVSDPPSVSDAPRPLSMRGWLPLAAAAAIVGLVGGSAAGIWWQSSRAPAAVPVVASATLEPQSSWEASGRAWVEVAADGHREVIVHLVTAGDAVLLREVWLVTADATGLLSIGFLDGAAGRFTIPAGIDLAAYPLVEVSAEFDDGDPAHSGDAIVLGKLN